jgi:hypothetical protein
VGGGGGGGSTAYLDHELLEPPPPFPLLPLLLLLLLFCLCPAGSYSSSLLPAGQGPALNLSPTQAQECLAFGRFGEMGQTWK